LARATGYAREVRSSFEEIEKRARAAHGKHGIPYHHALEVLAIGSGLSDGCIVVRDAIGRPIKRPFRPMTREAIDTVRGAARRARPDAG
jgi:hypothetical protein